MTDPEEILRCARLASPSEALDRRLQEAWAKASSTQPATGHHRTWRWLAGLAATGIAATLLVIATHPVHPPAPLVPTSCTLPAEGLMRELLLEPSPDPATPPSFVVSASTS